jgi:hypothetical protein
MSEHKPWWPQMKSLPFFTSSAQWEAQLSDDDRTELESDEDQEKEANEDRLSANPAPKKSRKQ